MSMYGGGGTFGGGMMNPQYGQYGGGFNNNAPSGSFGSGWWGPGGWVSGQGAYASPGAFGGTYDAATGVWSQNSGEMPNPYAPPSRGSQMEGAVAGADARNRQAGWDKARGDVGGWLGSNMTGILNDWRRGKFGPELMMWGSGGPGGRGGMRGRGGYQQGGMWQPGEGAFQPTEWSGGQSNIDVIDPRAYIEASKAPINRQLEASMAEAAARAGATGAMTGSPYMGALGEAAGNAAEDIAALTQGAWLDASKFNASNQLAAQQADLDRQLQAWGQYGDWGQQGLDRSLGAWEGAQNRDLDAWSQWNNWQMQGAQMNDPFMAQLMGLMGQG